MSKMQAKDIVKPTLVLLAIAVVTTLLLAVTNALTAPIIAKRQEEALIASLQVVMPDADSFSDPKTLTVNEGDESALDPGEYQYFEAYDASGEKIGIVATGSTNGYADVVEFTVGVNGEGYITGLEALTLNETPAIGMRAADPEFQKQFVGKTGPLQMTGGDGENEVDGLSGATVTSHAVVASVNEVLNIANMSYGGTLFEEASGPEASEQLKAVVPDADHFSVRMQLTVDDGAHDAVPAGDYYYYLAYDAGDEVLAAVVVSTSKGFGGDVTMMSGLTADATVTGVVPVKHSETPGYGAKIDDAENQEAFVGLTAPLTVGENYDGISGATVSSKAYADAVNQAAGVADLVLNQGMEGVEAPEDPDAPDDGSDDDNQPDDGGDEPDTPDGHSSATVTDPDSWSGPTPENVTDKSQWPDAQGSATPSSDDQDDTSDDSDDGENTDGGSDDKDTDTPGGASEDEVVDALREMTGDADGEYAALTTTLEEGDAGEAPADTYIYYELPDDQLAVLTWSANGFGGGLEVLTLMDADGSIVAVRPVYMNETPNIGTNVENAEFLDQFQGISETISLGENVDAVSNATISSRAVVEAVNYALDFHHYITGGES